ncbi:MAG: ATP-binding protein [Pseudomonadota bacterium]
MATFNLILAVCVAYVAVLFAVAFWAERKAVEGGTSWLRSPIVYTLSLSVYCTAWTFYGAVGFAARSGLEFITIYLGPTLVVVGWWWILRKLVTVARAQSITSIADLLSSRYGKSNLVAILVTLLAVVGTTPYIALQLQSVTLSFNAFSGGEATESAQTTTAIWVAIGLAFFTILFGTRTLDVNERHHGVVMAIAVEAVVKLAALVAVGFFVVWGVADGPADIMQKIDNSRISQFDVVPSRWIGLIFVAGAAFICLPRMFQVLVVENGGERDLAVASWAFPAYLAAISLFVIPIAVVGLEQLPNGNPDLFVLSVPLAMGEEGLAMLAFLGGFSSATSMVIVASLALATMVSNHIVMPLYLRRVQGGATVSGDVRDIVLQSRRVSIGVVMALGYVYYKISGGSAALAAIGLISFTGVVQVLPALLGGLFWRGATRVGASAGLVTGFSVWAYTLFVPTLWAETETIQSLLAAGPFGWSILNPQALFGTGAFDPIVHAVFWSMLLNTSAFVLGSLLSFPTPMERLQGAQFVNADDALVKDKGWSRGGAETEDLLVMAQRILGPDEAQSIFSDAAQSQGLGGYLPDSTPDFIKLLERRLSGSVGSATAHAMMSQIVGGASVSVEELMAMADESAQMMEYSNQLKAKTDEISRTARQLRDANTKLTQLSVQKDAFLSQISHELRTPMTSIRAFSEILGDPALGREDRIRYSDIIHAEAIRLTGLLDALLDLSVLENGQVSLNITSASLGDVLDRAVASGAPDPGKLKIQRRPSAERVMLSTDVDRLAQVFINLIANAQKYCESEAPTLTIYVQTQGEEVQLDFIDNGKGIARDAQDMIFEKFSRLSDQAAAGGAGLGLAICREIMTNLQGSVEYLPGQGGAAFRVRFPIELSAQGPDRSEIAAQ